MNLRRFLLIALITLLLSGQSFGKTKYWLLWAQGPDGRTYAEIMPIVQPAANDSKWAERFDNARWIIHADTVQPTTEVCVADGHRVECVRIKELQKLLFSIPLKSK